MTTAQEAMDAANEARREVAGLDGRMGAMETTVRDHRKESQDAHRETQRMVRELHGAVAHIKGQREGEAAVDVAKPDRSGALVVAGTIATAVLVPVLLAAAAAMGLPVTHAPTAPVAAQP